MLVLTRKEGEGFSVNHGGLIITIEAIEGNTVRVGFEGDPATYHILRLELTKSSPPSDEGNTRAA